jgi:DNA-binding CsgD family transcriptional regulator
MGQEVLRDTLGERPPPRAAGAAAHDPPAVHGLSRSDLEGVLAFLRDAAEAEWRAPFPRPVPERLERLVPGCGIGWFEQLLADGSLVESGFSRPAWWDRERWARYALLDPIAAVRDYRPFRPRKYSDLVDVSASGRDPFVVEWLRPSQIGDRLVVWLPAPPGRRRSITFDRFSGELTERDRTVVAVVSPHLSMLWESVDLRRTLMPDAHDGGLTPRQLEILRWVARGRTNGEIARLLTISPGTVRKHLDNVFATLGVNSRTAAATLVFGGL